MSSYYWMTDTQIRRRAREAMQTLRQIDVMHQRLVKILDRHVTSPEVSDHLAKSADHLRTAREWWMSDLQAMDKTLDDRAAERERRANAPKLTEVVRTLATTQPPPTD